MAPFCQFLPALVLFTWAVSFVSCLALEFGISSLVQSHFINRGSEVGGVGGRGGTCPRPQVNWWS